MKQPKLTLNKNGTFTVDDVDRINHLYFPLTNFYSLKSSITPSIGGDSKIDQNHFALLPVSEVDLSNSLLGRNMYFRVNDSYTWSISGQTPYQLLHRDHVSLEADFLIHHIQRDNQDLLCRVESFVPMNETYQEWHRVTIKNSKNKQLVLKPVIHVPLYARSADNLRDHRHVTSLLNKATIYPEMIVNKPTFSFDERGHQLNQTHYGVKVFSSNGCVKNYWPLFHDFIGEGESILDPKTVKEDRKSTYRVNDTVAGEEVSGGFEFEKITLNPNEEATYIFVIQLSEKLSELETQKVDEVTFDTLKQLTQSAWKEELSTLEFGYADDVYNGWLKWVTLQPILRRIYGCSFLPHHDYGRGGRGWRDLWQDLLALILMNPESVSDSLKNNFLGVRIDGSNATIIGEEPGEFLADRNHIARVWMDHGAWPLLTTLLYINHTGDYGLLFEETRYFKDQFSHYTKRVNKSHKDSDVCLKTNQFEPYYGSIIEHLLIQNLVPFYNVGSHRNIRIEDADWNDALDMASNHGESVAFTNLYAYNLITLSDLLVSLEKKGTKEIALLEELAILLTVKFPTQPEEKQRLLTKYFNAVENEVSGKKIQFNTLELAKRLRKRGESLQNHVRDNEWLTGNAGAYFNGYYDGDGFPLEDASKGDMTLTGQVFAIYGGTASDKQIQSIINSADALLFDEIVGGYKLNTNFNDIKLNMGRLFGFAYGHKENGAMFSHMAVMYANALYKRGYVKAGNKVLDTIYKHCIDINKSKIYPGIPEYIGPDGRGMYHYLTGSASWLILTQVTEVFGVKGDLGTLVLEPKLLKNQFDSDGIVSIKTVFQGLDIVITYENKNHLDYGSYIIDTILVNQEPVNFTYTNNKAYMKPEDLGSELYVVLKAKK